MREERILFGSTGYSVYEERIFFGSKELAMSAVDANENVSVGIISIHIFISINAYDIKYIYINSYEVSV